MEVGLVGGAVAEAHRPRPWRWAENPAPSAAAIEPPTVRGSRQGPWARSMTVPSSPRGHPHTPVARPEHLGDERLGMSPLGQRVAVAPIRAGGIVIGVQGHTDPDRDGLLAGVEMSGPMDLAAQEQTVHGRFELAADEPHAPVRLEVGAGRVDLLGGLEPGHRQDPARPPAGAWLGAVAVRSARGRTEAVVDLDVLGLQCQPGRLRTQLDEGGEVHRVALDALEPLHDLLGGGRQRHRHVVLAGGLEAEVEVLEQELGGEGGREVQVDVGRRLVARSERGALDAVVEELQEVGPRHASLLGQHRDLRHALGDDAEHEVVADLHQPRALALAAVRGPARHSSSR